LFKSTRYFFTNIEKPVKSINIQRESAEGQIISTKEENVLLKLFGEQGSRI
jgi:hypothetical protein